MGVRTPVAGHLGERITLQRRVESTDALGQASQAWVPMIEVWASAEPLRGREFFAAGQTQSDVTTRFVIRYRQDVTNTMRVVWRGEPYDILSVVEPLGQRQMLELMCSQGVKDGR
jgi:SPP1 family predicted phage head-tail adaptor